MTLHLACDNDIFPPLFGATQRLFGLARGMATRLGVRALCVVPNRSRGADTEQIAGVEIRRVRSWHTSVAWWLERAGVAPLFTAESGHRRRAAAYRALLGEPGDILMCDLALTGLFPGAERLLRVYHAHNVEAERWRSVAPRVWGRERWGARLAALERRAVQESDCCVACTEEDAALLRSLHGARDVIVAENGYDETLIAPADEEARARARAALGIPADAYVAAFVGGDWAPNHEALAFLLEFVFPGLAGDRFVLLAVGAVARRFAHRREPWLVTRAETPDLGVLLAAADVGLNPVTSGGGSNVKLPTYLGAGLAVLSTPFGQRGHTALAAAVTTVERGLFSDALRRRPRGWAARGAPPPSRLADYSWGAIGARLADSLATRAAVRAIGGRGTATSSAPGTPAERSSAGGR
ncbi:MAG TPA: hypothetical protein VN896_14215 [Methylomirabilota bacterium]|nr:hypothetical protein [Methylomirabilota bacterium]